MVPSVLHMPLFSYAASPAPRPPVETFAHVPMSLVKSDDPVLRQVAAPVPRVNAAVHDILDDMGETMRTSGGCGLAAPQVGIPYRLIVVKAGGEEYRLANPHIESRSGVTPSLEGCLSLPGQIGLTWRSAHVVVKAQDDTGRDVAIDARGLKARCLQHEIDHLDGKLFTDRACVTGLHVVGALTGGVVGAVLGGRAGAMLGASAGIMAAWSLKQLRS